MKKTLAIVLVLAMMLTMLCACGKETTPAASNEGTEVKTYKMRIGTLTVEAEQNTATALDFAERIKAATNGQVEVEVYPSAQLGTAAQMVEGMQTGTIEGALFPADYLSSADPTIGFVSVPGFAGYDIESLRTVMNDLGGMDIVNEFMTKAGLRCVGFLNTDKYSYLLSDRKVESIADCEGMKIWAPPSEYTSAIISGMGGTATFFDTSDLAVSVQQGTVNGALASPALYAAQKLYETDKFCIGFDGRSSTTVFVMSEAFLQGLPEDLRQTVIDTAMVSVKDFEYDYAQAAAERNLQVLKDNGCEVYNSSDIPALQAELEVLYKQNLDLYLSKVSNGQELYDQFQALLAKYDAQK